MSVKIPCGQCIVFAVCKQKLNEFSDSGSGFASWSYLYDNCEIIEKFFEINKALRRHSPDNYDLFVEIEQEFRKLYGKKYKLSYRSQITVYPEKFKDYKEKKEKWKSKSLADHALSLLYVDRKYWKE